MMMSETNQIKPVLIMPALALRGMVAFPGVAMHFDVKRQKSILAIKAAMDFKREIFIVTQSELEVEDPLQKDLYSVGVVCVIKQLLKADDSTIRVLVEGQYKARLVRLEGDDPYLSCEIKRIPRKRRAYDYEQEVALIRLVKAMFKEYCYALPNVPREIIARALAKETPPELFNAIVPNLLCTYEDKQALLECPDSYTALEMLAEILERECTLLEIEHSIFEKVKQKMDKNQRDYFLREQLRVIEDELGEGESTQEDAYTFAERLEELKHMPESTREKLMKECERLSRLPAMSQEANVITTYLDTVLSLPWDESTKDILDVKKAEAQLNRDHYGLKKVKERILELLAVRQLTPDIKGQIICLVGPPGVGKTSIAASIAKALHRNYVRVSLGGVHDESEIRGHRKTYLGSMPGRIINAFKQAKSNNPLILLDEIDKVGSDHRGDPASALLEALDSEQNTGFVDHYIDVPFDLSKALFLTTANTTSTIPGPLLDRMEVIELSSYTREEKFQIARQYLVKKQAAKHGLSAKTFAVRDGALRDIIDGYTREAGVRTLERKIGALCRKAAARIVAGENAKVVATPKNLEELLGPAPYRKEKPKAQDQVGVVNGLAWTSVGGEMLEIECAVLPGSGKVQLTGSLGDVMKESAEIAISYVRSVASQYGIDPDFHKNCDIHIHAPEGAVPKDGPSAGVTMTTALVSALSGIPVRGEVAMTGEISLRGRVMPIGGLKEKSMAAYREQKTVVLIPKENEPEIKEFDPVVLEAITFVPAERLEEVLEVALVPHEKKLPEPEVALSWSEPVPVIESANPVTM